jgi:hypothetical protein
MIAKSASRVARMIQVLRRIRVFLWPRDRRA